MTGTMQEPKNSRGTVGRINTVLGPAMVGVDTIMRVKDGESVPVALGKAVATNALWAMVPGGVLGGVAVMAGITAAQMAPEVGRAISGMKSQVGAKTGQFASAGHFQETEAQQAMLQQGFGQIQAARQNAVRVVANHARNAQRVY